MSARALLALLAFLGAAGCAEPPAEPPPQAAAFALSPVVDTTLAELEARVAADASPAPAVEPAELEERLEGLLAILTESASASMRSLAVEDAAALGDAAVEPLAAIAGDAGAPETRRSCALELLGALDTPGAAEALLLLLATGEPGWVRAHAAWRLGGTRQEQAVFGLLHRLKYETDFETVVWIASALAAFGNFAGLAPLEVVQRGSGSPKTASSAAARAGEIAAAAGFDDLAGLRRAWDEGALGGAAAAPERSARYRLELWRWIARFREYQLRGVDDARYVLASLDADAAPELARALADESLYVRLHTAQSLQRMGPRGRAACAELVRALDEPGVAANAAEALGTVGCASAESDLVTRLAEDTRIELRLAAARALGFLGDDASPAAAAALEPLLDPAVQPELRQAAAESLVRLGASGRALAVLLDALADEGLEHATTERALRAWLARLAEAAGEGTAAADVLARWDALAPADGAIVPVEEEVAARAARAELVRAHRDELLGDG